MKHQKVIKNLSLDINDLELFLFGSINDIYKKNINDIDLLVVYNPDNITFEEITKYRYNLRKQVIEEFTIKCDIILLTINENLQTKFSITENAVKVDM